MLKLPAKSWGARSISSKILVVIGLSMLVGQGGIIALQTVSEDAWRHDSALEVNRVLTTLMANQAGRAIEAGDEADLEAIYFDVAFSDAHSDARSQIAGLTAYDLRLQRVKSYFSLNHLDLDENLLRDAAGAAQQANDLVHLVRGDLHIFAAPVLTQLDRQLVGTLVVAWDNKVMEAQTREALLTHVGVSALAALALLATVLLLMRRAVVSPIRKLTDHVLVVKRTGYLAEQMRPASHRADEIGVLSREFNSMLLQLADARRRLLDQSYHAGVAEAAAGVLHNIRNTLHPAATAVWSLRRTIDNPVAEHLQSALDELAAADTPAERRNKLAQYVRKIMERGSESQAAVRKHVDIITRQLDQIDRILDGFGQTTKATSRFSAVNVRAVVEDAAQLVRQKPGSEKIQLEIDDSVRIAPSVHGQEVVLIQLLGNLFVNAYESIVAAERLEDGRVRVDALDSEVDGQRMLTLRVHDNGQGIDPAHLNQLFERGFSTRQKKTGGGIGLHWCANSALAMGGRLRAHSSGPGTGATFELCLPLAAGVVPAAEGIAS